MKLHPFFFAAAGVGRSAGCAVGGCASLAGDLVIERGRAQVSASRERSRPIVASATSRLPVQPVIARAVLDVLEHGEGAVMPIARLVDLDPALTVAVMRLANSPHLGLSRKVASSRQALVMLGTKAVQSLAASGTAAIVLGANDVACPAGYWTRSLTTAVASANIARRVGAQPEEAFSAGMLTEIGDLLLRQIDTLQHDELREDFGAVYDRRGIDLETRELGASHVEVGADLLDRWWFPERVVRAVRLHHERPEVIAETLARVVRCGAAVTACVLRERSDDEQTFAESYAVFGVGVARCAVICAEVEAELAGLVEMVQVAR